MVLKSSLHSNSVEEVQKEMLKELGLDSLEDLHAEIPEELKLKSKLNLPEPLNLNMSYKKWRQTLEKNKTCKDYINF